MTPNNPDRALITGITGQDGSRTVACRRAQGAHHG